MNIKNGSWDNLKPRSDNRAFYFPRIAVKPYGIWEGGGMVDAPWRHGKVLWLTRR